MKTISTKIDKIAFTLSVPSSIEEFDSAHNRAGAVLDQGVKYDVAHTILSKIRTKAAAELVKLGATRDIERHDDKGEPVYKPCDVKWFARQFAALEIGTAEQAAFYQRIADEIGYDVSGTRSSNKEFNQVDLKDAKAWLEAQKLGKTTFETLKTKLEARNPGYVLELDEDGTASVETIAAGLKIERARVEAERQASLF